MHMHMHMHETEENTQQAHTAGYTGQFAVFTQDTASSGRCSLRVRFCTSDE